MFRFIVGNLYLVFRGRAGGSITYQYKLQVNWMNYIASSELVEYRVVEKLYKNRGRSAFEY